MEIIQPSFLCSTKSWTDRLATQGKLPWISRVKGVNEINLKTRNEIINPIFIVHFSSPSERKDKKYPFS